MHPSRDQLIEEGAGEESRPAGEEALPSEPPILPQSQKPRTTNAAPAKPQKRPGRPPGLAPASHSRFSTGKTRGRPLGSIRNAVFTSQRELDLIAGVPGVYIDPKGYEKPDTTRRQPGTCIAVFKSEKLKDSEWLEKNKGTWIEVSAERFANRLLEGERAAAPRKRDAYNRKRKGDPEFESGSTKKAKVQHQKSGTASKPTGETTSQSLTPPKEIQNKTPDLGSQSASIVGYCQSQTTPLSAALETVLPSVHSPAIRNEPQLPPPSALEPSPTPTGAAKSSITKSVETASSERLAQPPTLQAPQIPSKTSTVHANMVKHSSALNEVLSESESEIIRGAALMRQNFEARSHSYHSPFSPSGNSPQPYISPFSATSAPSQRQPLPERPAPLVQGYPPHFQTPAIPRPPGSGYLPPHPSGPAQPNQNSQAPPLPYSFPGAQFPQGPMAQSGPGSMPPLANSHLTSPPGMAYPPFLTMPLYHPMAGYYGLPYPFPFHPQVGAPYGQQMHHLLAPNSYHQHPTPLMQQQPEEQSQISNTGSSDQSANLAGRSSAPSGVSSSATTQAQPQVKSNDIVPQSEPLSNLSEVSTATVQNSVKSAKRKRVTNKAKCISAEKPVSDLNKTQSLLAEDAMPTPTNAELAKFDDSSQRSLALRKQKTQDFAGTELDSRLSSAEAIAVPEGRSRLACVFRDVVGNLLLSQDLTTLEFFGVDQHAPEVPFFTLPIAKVSQNPITSIPGSKPMELRIKVQDDQSTEINYCFAFASNRLGSEAASSMRAKIVTAMIAVRFRAGEAYDRPQDMKQEIVKPYQCEKCGNRYLNINGLQYHQKKSASTCNPNWDPSTATPRKTVPKPPKAEMPARAVRVRRKSQKPVVSNVDQATSPEAGGESDSSSEDSIIEWAKQNSTNGFGKPAKPAYRATERTYKALNNESPILKELVRDIANVDASKNENAEANIDVEANKNVEAMEGVQASKDVASNSIAEAIENVEGSEIMREPPKLPPSTVADDIAKQLLIAHPTETLSEVMCEEIIMAVIRGYSNLFPGERSLWFACVAIWLKMYPTPHELPKSTLTAKALDNLLDDKRVERMQFHFNYKKRLTTRSILYIPGTELNPSRNEMLRKLIQESHPVVFVPSQFAPPPMVLSRLQALSSFTVAPKIQREETDSVRSDTVESVSPPADLYDVDSSYEDDFVAGNEVAVESGSDAIAFESEESEAEDAVKRNPSKTKRRSGKRPKSAGNPRRSASHNAAIAEGMRRKWDDIRAGGDNPFSRGMQTKRPESPLTQKEKERHARQTALRQQSWSQAPSFLPNPETGAWDQAPPKHKATYDRRQCLPEPITFMQDPSGAWSVRPFGHGVKPIHARPARRADGNPMFDHYLKNLQKYNGFRPLIYPTKNRLFLPSVPSKRLAREISASQEDVPKTPDSPKNDAPYIPDSPQNDTQRKRRRRRTMGILFDNPDTPQVRISKDTGKPVRKYDRHFQRRESTIEPAIQQGNSERDEVVEVVGKGRYGTRKAAREAEVALLNFYEPQKLGPEAPPNPGLESLPPSFGLDSLKYQGPPERELIYEKTYTNIVFRTPRDVDQQHGDPNYGSWTIDHLKTSSSADYNLRWDEQTAFTLETLPYTQLEDTIQPSRPVDVPSPVDLDMPPPKRQRRAANNKRPTTFGESKKYGFRRTLTALTTDFDGLLDGPEQALEYGVQVAQPTGDSKKRKRAMGDMMTPAIEARFLVAVVVVVTLTGGLDEQIDWVLVGTMFPNFSIHFMRKHWIGLFRRKEEDAQRLTEDFQEAFPKAYESGEVDPIDYDHLPDYNWAKLVRWVMKNVDKSQVTKEISLPNSKKQLMETLEHRKSLEDPQGWRKFFYDQNAPTYRRIGVASAEANTIPVPISEKPVSYKMDKMVVAKSFVRAIALTPKKDWKQSVARAKCAALGDTLVQNAMDILMDARMIVNRAKGRDSPFRSYEVSDAFSAPLRKQVKGKDFIEAAAFKQKLDKEFKLGKTCVRVDYFAEDGSIMAISSLQANGRIKLIPIDVPANRFGLTNPGSYETRKIPPERMRFEMDIYPTEYYLYDDENILLQRGLSTPPPRGSEMGEIPIWYGITDVLIEDIWGKVLANVGQILALRAGTNMEWLKRIFKPTMEEWELRVLMQWGEQVGYFERLSEGVEGWTAGEWWWLVAGRSCVPEPEKK